MILIRFTPDNMIYFFTTTVKVWLVRSYGCVRMARGKVAFGEGRASCAWRVPEGSGGGGHGR